MLTQTPTVFAIEPFSVVFPEMQELLRLHWKEVAPHQDLLTLNPDVARYEALQRTGNLHIVTARMGGNLIGYIAMLVSRHLHYKHVKLAVDDVHFLHADHRHGGLGMRLMKAAEDEMRKLGVQVMTLRTKVAQDHGALFVRLGYSPMDIVYVKRLDQEG